MLNGRTVSKWIAEGYAQLDNVSSTLYCCQHQLDAARCRRVAAHEVSDKGAVSLAPGSLESTGNVRSGRGSCCSLVHFAFVRRSHRCLLKHCCVCVIGLTQAVAPGRHGFVRQCAQVTSFTLPEHLTRQRHPQACAWPCLRVTRRVPTSLHRSMKRRVR